MDFVKNWSDKMLHLQIQEQERRLETHHMNLRRMENHPEKIIIEKVIGQHESYIKILKTEKSRREML